MTSKFLGDLSAYLVLLGFPVSCLVPNVERVWSSHHFIFQGRREKELLRLNHGNLY